MSDPNLSSSLNYFNDPNLSHRCSLRIWSNQNHLKIHFFAIPGQFINARSSFLVNNHTSLSQLLPSPT
ncbi:hypothetical protein EUGRSUZ_A02180 [Eucalyptus grandis]|uniref:Uncharacterized protein n=2 Tax=Eucalyptus grandis TaxID=71139 RepID=A0ACC3M6W8_EUCGR|nr:hypothetical protein EUGRSUZ_A02180 [Eucalyptus grandis]